MDCCRETWCRKDNITSTWVASDIVSGLYMAVTKCYLELETATISRNHHSKALFNFVIFSSLISLLCSFLGSYFTTNYISQEGLRVFISSRSNLVAFLCLLGTQTYRIQSG
ncbi:hypothetical protein Ddye_002791 [Dipteronia dyeriana]|uniref:Uncharacterized protein n=1 Tax=Dipteronia dyeriana TaxID=168575 RepID=A0AAD9XS85_9ROSI|nr:hypothetical protein Ddye_002791 [Dipteronia dyeriana]